MWRQSTRKIVADLQRMLAAWVSELPTEYKKAKDRRRKKRSNKRSN